MRFCLREGTYYFKDFHMWYLVGSFAVGLFFRGGFLHFSGMLWGRGVESFNMDILIQILIIAVFTTRSRVQNKKKTKHLFHAGLSQIEILLKWGAHNVPVIKNKKIE